MAPIFSKKVRMLNMLTSLLIILSMCSASLAQVQCYSCFAKYNNDCVKPEHMTMCAADEVCQSVTSWTVTGLIGTQKRCIKSISCTNPNTNVIIGHTKKYCCSSNLCNSGSDAPVTTTTSSTTTTPTTTPTTTMTPTTTSTATITTMPRNMQCYSCYVKFNNDCLKPENVTTCAADEVCQSITAWKVTGLIGTQKSCIKSTSCTNPNTNVIIGQTKRYCCSSNLCNSGSDAPVVTTTAGLTTIAATTTTGVTTAAATTTTAAPTTTAAASSATAATAALSCYVCEPKTRNPCNKDSDKQTCANGMAGCFSEQFRSALKWYIAKRCVTSCPVPDTELAGGTYGEFRYCCIGSNCNLKTKIKNTA